MQTLFSNPEFAVYSFKTSLKRDISLGFMKCMDKQLTALFELKTGIKVNKQISTTWEIEFKFFVDIGHISKMPLFIYVNHSWNPIIVLWKSKSKRIYKIEDIDIDCEDIEFWFEDLDVALIHKQLYPNVKLPFKLEDLSYELIVTRINMDATIEMKLRPEHQSVADKIIDEVDSFIAKFNKDSEKKDRKYGVIYNWTPKIEQDNIVFDINLGSTGPYFFKKLFPFLSQLNYFERVELC